MGTWLAAVLGVRRERTDRGALAVWASLALVAFVLAVGLGVDLAGHASAQQHARSVATEAARAGGQYLVISPGTRPRPDTHRAVRAADAYVAASNLEGRATATGDELAVEVQGRYQTLFLGIVGVDALPLRGSATARALTVIDGESR